MSGLVSLRYQCWREKSTELRWLILILRWPISDSKYCISIFYPIQVPSEDQTEAAAEDVAETVEDKVVATESTDNAEAGAGEEEAAKESSSS